MAKSFAEWEKADLGIEAAVDLMVRDREITQRVASALRTAYNQIRIPELIRKVGETHPALTKRKTIRAVALFCGLGDTWVKHFIYSKRCNHANQR